jgi:glycoside hydrolase-like protein
MKLKTAEIKDFMAYLSALLAARKPQQGKPIKKPTVFHPRFGIDFAWGTPSVRGLRSAGVTFVARYLSPAPNSKNLRRSEVRAYHQAGLGIVTVWESTATRALEGRAAGERDAERAKQMLRDLGAPAWAVVFFAVDFEDRSEPVGDYFRGAAHILGKGRVGVYGGYHVVKRLFDAGLVTHAWQTYAWSGGAWDHRAMLRQFSNDHTIAGVSCDFDRAIGPHFGAW